MTDISLYTKITSLPTNLKNEVLDFVDFLIAKKKNSTKKQKKQRQFGYAKNAIKIKPGFDDPIEDFKDYM